MISSHSTSSRPRWMAVFLAILMGLTRYHHEGTAFALPDASLAVFFLAGWYLRGIWAFAGYLLLTFLIDYVAISYGGVSAYCISPAYGFLIPTYGVLWWAGHWAEARRNPGISGVGERAVALIVASSLAFLISNGSFYLFSGKVEVTGWATYAEGIAGYFPGYVGAAILYCGLIIAVESASRFKWPVGGFQVKLK